MTDLFPCNYRSEHKHPEGMDIRARSGDYPTSEAAPRLVG